MNRHLDSTKNRRFDLMSGLGAGAVGAFLMYVFDPQIGRRRRALARDKMIRFAHKTFDAVDVTARDLKNRAVGAVAETRNLFSKEDVSDEILEQRVRSKLGALVSHPSSIEVNAENGKITFRGPILADEVERLLSRVSSMREVKAVDSRLEVHQEPGNVPGLQGEPAPRKSGETPDIMQASWSPTTRFIAGTAGGTVALYGLRQLNALGAAVSALGTAVLARALTNMEFKRLIGVGAGRRAVTIRKIINVAAPVEKVFAF